ncbi:MAG: F0F1 ATP synthase subunit B' [Campylobacter sputorum]|uniref:F0F1 ATP synthase subunit B family protein n=1 Tax=Campylobacter sputorum TaxID=206 RepID=UPI000B790D94|nr:MULTISPECIES: F0F1 ATP synthase subunit B' [Campylobacter]ASM39184.1 ATP synthase, F0 complex, b' subunit [Campylobacter sputorum bv. paraureolyticus LMG 11764]ASM40764.1 ATP synthase, F0 complex, b' subunit [Campylobacter sputorum]MBF6675258.1 F0F1 ATP synthase subunit B' [Campylobacter sp. RM13538]MBF6676885.1 F0F1 ATP synthase subunit B' [Campylobacter sp. RM12321]MDY6120886.1 F0F1 ATP synthase subunit B' [Campylobacter sputorum]
MLEFDIRLMIFTAIVFLFLIALLNKILYKPVIAFMDKREASIKEDEKNATRNDDDINAYIVKSNEIIINAKNEANKIKQDTLNDAKEKALKELDNKKVNLEEDYSNFISDLNKQKEEFKDSLLSKLPEFKGSLNDKFAKI